MHLNAMSIFYSPLESKCPPRPLRRARPAPANSSRVDRHSLSGRWQRSPARANDLFKPFSRDLAPSANADQLRAL
jgi:hypothetical protein